MSNVLEDSVFDITGKAQRGLKIDDETLSARAGVTAAQLAHWRAGHFDPEVAGKLAKALELNPRALQALPTYLPAPVAVEGLAMFSTPWEDMVVNAYLFWTGDEATAVDTGTECSEMLEFLKARGLRLTRIFLTHTHGDHVYELDRLKEKTGATAYVSNREPIDGAEVFEPGHEFQVGPLRVETRLTWGHTPGGITYVVHGLDRPVAFVGDALFAGSMGGAPNAYAEALQANRREIFSLPQETVLCPGHGPLTTVGEELQNNVFFAV